MSHPILLHGLVISVPFDCPGMTAAPAGASPDVIVTEGAVPGHIADAEIEDETYMVSASAFLLRGGAASGRFLVTGGRAIRFERGARCDPVLLRHVLFSRVMAGLLRQRDLLVLHASGVVSPAGVVLLTGESGAGKSTTVAALASRGWPLQTDDLTALRLGGDGGAEVLPGARHIHLFEGASRALAIDPQGAVANPWHRMKMAVPSPVEADRGARPLLGIVHLEAGPGGDVSAHPVHGGAKLPMLLHNIYGPYRPAQVVARAALVSRTLQQVAMMRVVRPDEGWSMDGVLALITNAVETWNGRDG